jgi:hypothetical protein
MSILTKRLGLDKIITNAVNQRIKLAADATAKKQTRTLSWTPKSVYRTRLDVLNWNLAQDMAMDVIMPRTYLLQLLINDIRLDALLTSQIENRKQQTFAAAFILKNESGEVDEEQTAILAKSSYYKKITNAILEKLYCWYSMIEFSFDTDGNLVVNEIPRTNFSPSSGVFYNDYLDATNPIKYRELPEYGKWILEFEGEGLGLLNKAVPHVLFKRFAQSCWSELCEIYGIPPRVLKTNTQDPTMLNRAEAMMRDMGAATWFIIDETESFEFASAQSGALNGDVYKNLIQLCDNQNTLLVTGAIIGQDTVNGNRSKEEVSKSMNTQLVQADMVVVEDDWNNIVIPALVKLGVMPAGLTFKFEQAEDIDQLFKFTTGLLPFKDIDNEWLIEKFGVKVIGNKTTGTDVQTEVAKKLSLFFD